jgi:hypothetical protein
LLAHGRYVLLWFTRLPPDPVGAFQARIYDERLEGPGMPHQAMSARSMMRWSRSLHA